MKAKKIAIGLASAALLLASKPASATVSVYSWTRGGEAGSALADSSGLNHPFNASFSSAGGGNNATILSSTAAGGPLGGPTGPFSTVSIRWGFYGYGNSGSWVQGPNNTVPDCSLFCLPPTNWVMECWVLPSGTGHSGGGSGSQFLSTGSGQFGGTPGGVAFRTTYNAGDGTVSITANAIGPNSTNNFQIGDPVVSDKSTFIHVAVVNDSGVTTFYVNGAPNGTPTNFVTAPSGAPYIGSGQDTGAPFDGYIDEARYSTFAPGAFSTNDFLWRPAGPGFVSQPQSTIVWNGGAAPFQATAVVDPNVTYQWQRGNANIGGATGAGYNLNVVGAGDNGATFDVVLSSLGLNTTSSNATLTVLPVNTANVNFYQNTVTSEPSLIAYYPVDGNTGATLTDVKGGDNATLEGAADYDGRTNRTFGVRALRLQGNGDATINATPAFEFPGGNGTIETAVYLDTPPNPAPTFPNETIFSVADSASTYYAIQVSPDGGTLIYTNDTMLTSLQWSVPVPLLRRLAHVAVVINSGVNVTPYVDGQSLGTKTQAGFGPNGLPANIGSVSLSRPQLWNGTIDELAIYSSALSANTIAVHNSKFVNGTNVFSPTIVSLPVTGSKTLLAGGSPTFTVVAAGTAPLAYQWTTNGVPIPGATLATLTLSHTTIAQSGSYGVTVSNPINPPTNSPTFTLNFVSPTDTYSTLVMSENPSAYWRLDETSGTTAFDQAGGHDGTYQTGPSGGSYTLGVPGLIYGSDLAASFTTAANFRAGGQVVVPFSPALNPSGPFSIECFCVPNFSGNNGVGELVNSDFNSNKGWYLGAAVINNTWDFGLDNGIDPLNQIAADGGPVCTPAIKRYVAGVYDGTNAMLYVDGTLAATLSHPNFVPNPSGPLYIGSRVINTWAFGGPIDEVAFYNYALTPGQVANHLNTGEPVVLAIVPTTNLVPDSKPSGIPHDGVDHGAVWAASSSDGATTRSGVMQFTGTNANQITSQGVGDFDSTTGTIIFWMRSAGTITTLPGGGDGAYAGAAMFDRRAGSGGVVIVQTDQALGGSIYVAAGAEGSGSAIQYPASTPVSDNLWHQVAVTYDTSASGFAQIYVDGQAQGSPLANNAGKAWPFPAGELIELGHSHNGEWRSYDGVLDDVRLYSRVLTDAEVLSTFNSGALVDTSTLTARYNFDTAPVAGYDVSWTRGTVQSALSATGPYTTITNATSPFPLAPSGVQRYFRGVQPQ